VGRSDHESGPNLAKNPQRYDFFRTKCRLGAKNVSFFIRTNQGPSQAAMYVIRTNLCLGGLPPRYLRFASLVGLPHEMRQAKNCCRVQRGIVPERVGQKQDILHAFNAILRRNKEKRPGPGLHRQQQYGTLPGAMPMPNLRRRHGCRR